MHYDRVRKGQGGYRRSTGSANGRQGRARTVCFLLFILCSFLLYCLFLRLHISGGSILHLRPTTHDYGLHQRGKGIGMIYDYDYDHDMTKVAYTCKTY
jgi:hypothetical protein